MYLKMTSGEWQLFCLDFNVLDKIDVSIDLALIYKHLYA